MNEGDAPSPLLEEAVKSEGAPTENSPEVLIPEVIPAPPKPEVPPENPDDLEMIPKDLLKNTKRRLKLVYTAAKKQELRPLQWIMCRNDILYWVNIWCATYDPRKNPSTIPFITYPYEDKLLLEIVDCIRNQKDILIEKSRDMGVTWCVLLAFTWFWQFQGEGFDFLVGSRKEQYIDTIGNMDTLLEKIRFLIRNQPSWMRPKGFDFKQHSNYLKIVNPDTKATITGEATNNNFSRSGRRRAIFFDEFAFWECLSKDTEVLTDEGWIRADELNPDRKVYSMNPETEEAELMPILKLGYSYAEELISFKNKSVDLLVTPNHKMLIKQRYKNKLFFEEAHKTFKRKEEHIPLVSKYRGGDYPETIHGYQSRDWMSFLGWYISEGHISQDRIYISQDKNANPENWQEIDLLLNNMKINWTGKIGKSFGFNKKYIPKEMYGELKSLGKSSSKYIPIKYMNLHRDLLELLFDSLMKGDGTKLERNGRKDKWCYYTTSGILSGQVQELSQKIGLRATVSIGKKRSVNWEILFMVNIGFKTQADICSLKKRKVKYKDYAFCLTTPYHTIFVRRNGIACWVGNCDSQAWRASADASNCRIVVSTPCGFNNQFAKLRHSGAIKVTTLHWRLHPEKDQAWYENECKRRNNDSVEIAQELDINYEGSEEGVLFEFAELKKAVHNSPIMSQERIVIALDPAGQGEDEAVFYVGNNGNIVERKFIATSTDTQLAAEAMLLITKYKAQVFIADSIGNSVADIVVQLLGKNERGVKCIKFKSSEKATDPTYFNKRDEVYHRASIQMKSGNIQVDDDYTLMKQLNATKYKKDNGRIYINSKEEIKDVIGTSPDRADAWVLLVEGLKYTHSFAEVKAVHPFRNNFNRFEEVRSGEEYGSWGDLAG